MTIRALARNAVFPATLAVALLVAHAMLEQGKERARLVGTFGRFDD